MPSEQRLHPISILFGFGQSLMRFAVPGLLVLVFGRSSAGGGPDGLPSNWEIWMMLLLVPAALHALARYLSFRLRYDDDELVIRSGLVFRRVRHVPYARIQNLEAVRNVFHRAFGVVEIRVETASGKEPEATLSVMPLQAFDEIRRRVFEGRQSAGTPPADTGAARPAAAAAPAREETLLEMSLRDLLLCGFIENRGLILIGALYGALWEFGPLAGFWSRLLDEGSGSSGVIRDTAQTIASGRWPPLERIGVVLAGLAGFLLLVRAVSMGWALVRLHGFRLSTVDQDLRTEFGLFTRVAATIPLRRIQAMTIRDTPLHRLTGRASVRVETAGGQHPGRQAGIDREWLAPLVRTAALPAFVRHVMPALDLEGLDWQPVHPQAFRRAIKPALVWALVWTLALVAVFDLRAATALPMLAAWFGLIAHRRIARLAWAATGDLIAFRSGWLWRTLTVAPAVKIQAVSLRESPFDRRWAMARVRVDTAGAGEASHRIDIPYLPRETAFDLHRQFATLAAVTDFRW
jgi:putative membrane protein